VVGFYRGLWIPLVTISAVRAISFTIYNGTKEELHAPVEKGGYGWSREELLKVGASGAIGGAFAGGLISFGSAREFSLLRSVVRGTDDCDSACRVGLTWFVFVGQPSNWSKSADSSNIRSLRRKESNSSSLQAHGPLYVILSVVPEGET